MTIRDLMNALSVYSLDAQLTFIAEKTQQELYWADTFAHYNELKQAPIVCMYFAEDQEESEGEKE